MKKSKIGQVKIPSAFSPITTKTERSAVAVLMHWMRQIIETKNLDLGLPDVDTSGADRKSPDTIIYESRRSQHIEEFYKEVVCLGSYERAQTIDGCNSRGYNCNRCEVGYR